MTKNLKKTFASKKAGLPPGTLVHIGSQKTNEVVLNVIDYTVENFKEFNCGTIEESFEFKMTNSVSWINIDGLHDLDTISKIGEHFDLHHLLLEDILNTEHRPKAEEFDDYLFVTLKMLGISPKDESIITEQVSFILGPNWLISFQEQAGDIFENLRVNIRESKGNIRSKTVDYLFYRLIDTVVDNYYFVIEHISETIEGLESRVLKNPDNNILEEIQNLKKELIQLKRNVMPLREVVAELMSETNHLFKKSTFRYLKDVHEHIIQVNESIDSQQNMLSGITDLYLSGASHKMNQIMQVLTIISTIFIPLTFLAGIYGMNFEHMPELKWKYSYLMLWIVMILIFIRLLYYFRSKKWL